MKSEGIALSYLANTLKGSPILEISNAVKARAAKGRKVYNYTVGDFDPMIFPIPMELKKEVMKAYAEDYTNYPAAEGNIDLREAICFFEKEWNNIDAKPEEVLVGSGGRPLIYASFQTICDRSDKVIFPVPSWNNAYYSQMISGYPVVIHTKAEDGFMPTVRQLHPHIETASLICLCSPQNPTGTVFTRQGLKDICEMVVDENNRRGKTEKRLYLLFDAMYGGLARRSFPNVHPVKVCAEVKPYVIYINAISKIFAATGLRVGWCVGPSAVLSKMKNILSHMGAWAPMAEQKAVARLLPETTSLSRYFQHFKKDIADRLLGIYKGIRKLKDEGFPVDAIEPQGGIYLSVKIDLIGKKVYGKELRTAMDVANFLLEETGFAVLPFSAFGADEELPWFRISIGTCNKKDIAPMLNKLQQLLRAHKMANAHKTEMV